MNVSEPPGASTLMPFTPGATLKGRRQQPIAALLAGMDPRFRDAVNPRAPAFLAVLERALRFANVKDSGEVSLSRRVLTLAVIDAGLAEPDAHRSSAWLIPSARMLEEDLEGMLRRKDRSAEVQAALARSPRIAISETLVPIVARAREIATRTVGREVIDLRHFLFALTEDPGRAFVDFSRQPTEADLARMRAVIVDRVSTGPERSEKIGEWRKLLDEAPSRQRLPAAPEDRSEAPRGAQRRAKQANAKAPRKARRNAEQQDYYRTQMDDPAARDVLDRESFARVLSERIRRLRAEDGDNERGAFMLHIHGRWGSGKSSVLNFLKAKLEQQEGPGEPARVVVFNAWEHHTRKPPWWPFLSSIYLGVLADRKRPLPWRKRWRLRAHWWWWRLRADVIPILLILVVFGIAVYEIGRDKASVDTAVKIVGAVVTASAVIYAYGRSLMFGSQRAAQTYSELKADPMRRVVSLFGQIVDAIDEDLVVIIDDLDRCDADYIVELLEGIQNMFRAKPVTYVAAADRKWICTAFEKRYADFSARIAEPARPLGYLFLEKLFQISAGMPKLTSELQQRYLGTLTSQKNQPAEVSQQARSEAKTALATASTEAEIQERVKKVENDPQLLRAYREEAAVKITTPPLRDATEDRLQVLLPLMEANPRAMKRLVNEVAMAQARGMLEGRSVAPEARARWAMISLRWPQFAEYLAEHPDQLASWRPAAPGAKRRKAIAADSLPEAVRPLVGNKMVERTIGGPRDKGALTEKILTELLR